MPKRLAFVWKSTLWLFVHCCMAPWITGAYGRQSAIRTYYISAETINWNYLPYGVNYCVRSSQTADALFAPKPSPTFAFVKGVYRQYTDATFKVAADRPEHLGIVGPIIYAAVGDLINVTLYNRLPFAINIEPTGLAFRAATVVQPNSTAVYLWNTTLFSAPDDESNSTLWLYRSTVDVVSHTNAGLYGPIVITKADAALASGQPNIFRELFMFPHVVNERLSPFYPQNQGQKSTYLPMAINGYLSCNQPGLELVSKRSARWYLASVGSDQDVHSMHWHATTFLYKGHRMDAMQLYPGQTFVLDAYVDNPGIWLFHCHVNSHLDAGMMTLYTVTYSPEADQTDSIDEKNPKNRKYYIAAVQADWDYAPSGGDMCSGSVQPFPPAAQLTTKAVPNQSIGTKYMKALYVEYTDATFQTIKRRSAADEHLGLLGPTIRAAVGETITVVLKNMMPAGSNVITIHPHGVLYNKDAEGAPYNDLTQGNEQGDDGVAPGQSYTYIWQVPDRAGPGPNDPSSIVWMYHSHVSETQDTSAGLVGTIIITRAKQAKPNAMPNDVDREMMLLFTVFNEMGSFLWQDNLNRYLPAVAEDPLLQVDLLSDPKFPASNKKYSINGRSFCNLPGLTAPVNKRTRLYIIALGDMEDTHSAGAWWMPMISDSRKHQAVPVFAGSMYTVDLVPQMSGNFTLSCQLADHMIQGMSASFQVQPSNAGSAPTRPANTTLRTYHLAAEEVLWNYVPQGTDPCTARPFDRLQQVWTTSSDTTLGRYFKKAVYRRYSDASFTSVVPQHPSAGLVGPLMHAEVNDTLVVVFKNSLSFPVNVQVGGGLIPVAPLNITASQAPVPPGATVTFKWRVPPAAGPGPQDGSCVTWIYQSSVNQPYDTMAGLVGLLEVCLPGTLTTTGPLRPKDVDLELPFLSNIFDETLSPYFADSVRYQSALRGADLCATARTSGYPDLACAASDAPVFKPPSPPNPTSPPPSPEPPSPAMPTRPPPPPKKNKAGKAGGGKAAAERKLVDVKAGGPSSNAIPSPTPHSNVPNPTFATPVIPSVSGVRLWSDDILQAYISQQQQDYGLNLFQLSAHKHSLNGFMFCNMPPLNVTAGQRVRILSLGLGSELGTHLPIFRGQILESQGFPMSVAVGVIPGTMQVADFTAQTPGDWAIEAAGSSDLLGGMSALLRVMPPHPPTTSNGGGLVIGGGGSTGRNNAVSAAGAGNIRG